MDPKHIVFLRFAYLCWTQFIYFFYLWVLAKEHSKNMYIPHLCFGIMTHKLFKYFVDIRKSIKIISHIYLKDNLSVYIYVSLMVLCWRKGEQICVYVIVLETMVWQFAESSLNVVNLVLATILQYKTVLFQSLIFHVFA
jgi:hypothetical protein